MGEETGEKRIFFRTVPVFDVSMTDPLPGVEPVPLTPPAQSIEGDSHQHLIASLHNLARGLGYRVETRELPEAGRGGWCDTRRMQIVVAAGPANRQIPTLIHELVHALGLGYVQYGREQAEVLVDCVTYVVCSSAGLDVGGESIPCIAGWGEHGALDAIREYAHTIDTIARRHRGRSRRRHRHAVRRRADRHSTHVTVAVRLPHPGCSVRGRAAAGPAWSGTPPAGDLTRPRGYPAGGAPGSGAHAAPDRTEHPHRQRYCASRPRRRGRALPPPPPPTAKRGRARRQRAARADRGRLPDRLGRPAALHGRASHRLCLAARRRHPRSLQAERSHPPRATRRLFLTACAGELERGEHPEPAADTRDVADHVAERIQHAQRRHDLATIKPHDRTALYLKGLGYRYREIMQITGASYTAVNRRITEGRRALRNLERQRENAHPAPHAGREPDTPPPP